MRDLDGDKLYELILVDNHDLSKGLVKGYRKFTKGSIKSFAWNKANMALQWEGANVEGYIADWTLEDMDLDGTLELVYINGDVSGSLLGGKRSVVVVEKLYDKPE